VPTTDEASLTERLRDEGLGPSAWGNGPYQRYGAHDHEYDKVIVVAAGSIRFGLPELGDTHELAPGDRLELPAGTTHDAVVGGQGVACLEAHLRAGTFDAVNMRTAGTW
jgi:uncharacterized protein YjlB